ncbi:beta-1,4-endoxylanase [Mycena sp. CBHHK59/15]|nr:beta-1,4-endoxylanase [Mycena sp. CBHHK59/15]
MARFSASFVAILSLLPFAIAQSQEWGQCGGIGWTGPTVLSPLPFSQVFALLICARRQTCVAGTTCVESNPYYSQCLPGSAPPSGPSSTSTSTAAGSGSTGSVMLNSVAKSSAGKLYFGSATDNSELSDTAYVAILKNNAMFGQISPANSMKWDATEPEQGTFTFTQGDAIASFAKGNGQLLRGHNCVWYQQLPSWVNSVATSQLSSVLTTHVSTVVKHYAGQVYAWDVVNVFHEEPFNDDGSWRSFVFYNGLGTNYVTTALTAARAADPAAKLYINDYNIETAGAKATAMLNLVKALKAANVPIDGIGMESHLIVGEVPAASAFISNWEQFTALGVEVAVTELDIRMTLPATAALLAQQQIDFNSVVSACKAVAKCVGVTVWDYTDKYSWVPSTFSGQGEACPWDANLVPKPAFNGIAAGFTN